MASRDLAHDVLTDVLDCALIARPPALMLKQDAAFDAELKSLETEAVFIEDLLIVLPSTHPQIKSARRPSCRVPCCTRAWLHLSQDCRTLGQSVERPADQRTLVHITLSWQALRRETRQVSCPDQFLT